MDKLKIVEVADPAHRDLEGKSIEALAQAAGSHPLDWFLDFGLKEDLGTLFTAELLNSDEAAVGRLIGDPDSHVALSDAGAHLTFLCDAGFGLHLIGHWARDRGLMTIGEAVRKLTSQPAALFGMRDRGRLAPGYAADLLLFDPAAISRGDSAASTICPPARAADHLGARHPRRLGQRRARRRCHRRAARGAAGPGAARLRGVTKARRSPAATGAKHLTRLASP